MTGEVPGFEFHVARQARDRLQFDDPLFTLSGTVIFANFHADRAMIATTAAPIP